MTGAFGTHRDCGGGVVILDQSGPVWTVRCEACGWLAGVPARTVDPSIERRLLLDRAGLPARFAGVPFQEDDTNRQARRELRRWLQRYSSAPVPAPAVWGTPGSGKSHLLVALCERLIRELGVPVLFRSVGRLLDELQAGFDTGEHAGLWQRVLSTPVLVLDDLGAERVTDWRADRLARLVDERWERSLPIVLATNFPPGMWPRTVDARTVSRLRGMTFSLELGGRDRRASVGE